MLRQAALVAFVLLLFLVPTTNAHTTVGTSDGKYLVTVGNLNEPVTTFTKTGLDLAIRANTTARPGISGAHLTLNATLLAPNGLEHTEGLETQFGRSGAYSFENPYVLTLPGTYYLRLTGKVNDTSINFDRILVGSGPVPAVEDLTFPDHVQSNKQLHDRITSLEARLAELENQVEALPAEDEEDEGSEGGNAAGLDGLSLVAMLGAIAVVVARSKRSG